MTSAIMDLYRESRRSGESTASMVAGGRRLSIRNCSAELQRRIDELQATDLVSEATSRLVVVFGICLASLGPESVRIESTRQRSNREVEEQVLAEVYDLEDRLREIERELDRIVKHAQRYRDRFWLVKAGRTAVYYATARDRDEATRKAKLHFGPFNEFCIQEISRDCFERVGRSIQSTMA